MQLITTHAALTQFLTTPSSGPALVVALDVSAIEGDVLAADLTGVCFLGCRASPEFPAGVAARRGTVLPSLDGPPVPVFPDRLYRVRDLYAGFDPAVDGSWLATSDSRARSWFMADSTREPRVLPPHEFWAARTHDSFIESAITAFRAQDGRRAVGVMGGHDVSREAAVYRTVAVVARALTRAGRLIVTGGGPGLMEAANLGAFLAQRPDDALDTALRTLRTADDFRSHGWLQTAATVRADVLGAWDALEPAGATSLGIPTWLYGHEPPNMFASHSAKFFFNSLREDGLVTLADGGLIFAAGNAGTVQEIFQDATQNYYRGDDEPATPMVLLGSAHWDRDATDPRTGTVAAEPEHDPKREPEPKPLWPLLRQLAKEKGFESALTLTDDPDEIIAVLTGEPPGPGPGLARPRVG